MFLKFRQVFEGAEFLQLHKVSGMRYGEDPHQQAALYLSSHWPTMEHARNFSRCRQC